MLPGLVKRTLPSHPSTLNSQLLQLRVALRLFTANLTGKIHRIPRLYRYPYGLTGKMTPGRATSTLASFVAPLHQIGAGPTGFLHFGLNPLSGLVLP